jgi:hypothetical protein
MKKIIIILLLVVFNLNGFSQNKKTITLPNYDSKVFVWKGGDDKYYDVTFLYGITNKIDKKILDKVVMSIMVKSKFVLKNQLSYIPKNLTIIMVGDKYSAISEIIGKNGYGVESITKCFFEFDLEGNVTLTSTL